MNLELNHISFTAKHHSARLVTLAKEAADKANMAIAAELHEHADELKRIALAIDKLTGLVPG